MKDVRKTAILCVSAVVFVEHFFLLWTAGRMRNLIYEALGDDAKSFSLPSPTALLLSRSWVFVVTAVLLGGWTIWLLCRRDASPQSDRVYLVTMSAVAVFLYFFSVFVYLLPFFGRLIGEME